MKKLFTLSLLCGLWACKKDDKTPLPLPGGSVQITVYDATTWDAANRKGGRTQEATVQLFASRADYLAKKPAFTATTNNIGLAEFKQVPAGSYFIVAFKEDKSNTWDNGKGQTWVSDTIFQTEAEIKAPQTPVQQNAIAGDFRFKDLNGDGMISESDVTEAPFTSITAAIDSTISKDIIIGYKSNSQASLYKSFEEVDVALHDRISGISYLHRDAAMLDGILSDDADCRDFPDWCMYDQFTLSASSSVISWVFWENAFTSIRELNRTLISLQQIGGDNAALIAQAKAARAFVYLELSTYFGALPLVEKTTIPGDISRASLEETRAFIKKDLNDALPSLPDAPPANRRTELTTGAANMMLARLALLEKNPVTMISYTDKIISSGKYTLADSAQVFVSASNSEIIWNQEQSSGLISPFKEYFVRGGLTVNFLPVIRYTETYLLNALAHTMINDIDGATEAINKIRTRGKKPAISFTTIEDARKEVDALSKEELYREGFRFRYLVATGQAMQVLSSKGYHEYNALLPVYMDKLSTYPNLYQNVGY
ncbi:RagB/SusD family nutrient uptake outer membrane protein [Chitinophaga filiformis]|uniref:RagB/SusD family nutrient uptake outer membrane protein n=1 Tax=Chitinophaga filiformis TaxID=104663 RepID=UPI001F345516|nr:RagB/SusD family nutrient uptake outer membrane protein [Chitinophaga filiformis]MCF6402053.1 RagB/SusD family nutrient uptake outer membrane protein [Chitinophaga filiformis]